MESIQNDKIEFNQKKVLLRLDLNVPLENGKITDTNRIDKIIPTIKLLLNKNAKIIIISHVGRPKGKVNNALSLRPVCESIKNKINQNVILIKSDLKKITSSELFTEENERVIMFENLRFYEEEEANDSKFAKHLASMADIYVNDAFSCSHREHASIVEITKFIPSYAGLQLAAEIEALSKITSKIEKPITCIIGGSKISTKINIIKNLINKFDNIVIVGGMANNIFKLKGYNIGKSIYEKNCDEIIKEIFSLSKKKNCKIIYPVDASVGKNFNDKATIKDIKDISKDEFILDIGPKTLEIIYDLVNKTKTILWNGPAGYFENPNFANGSFKIAKKIVELGKTKKIYSVVGGGDTVAVLNNLGVINNFDFVSTAGGAFLEFLEGKELPGIKALK